MTFSSDVLPAPLGPMMARISPASISTLTSLSAWTAPKARAICCACSKGARLAIGAVNDALSALSATAISSLGDCTWCVWRRVAAEKHATLVEALYVSDDRVTVETQVVIRAIQGLDERR